MALLTIPNLVRYLAILAAVFSFGSATRAEEPPGPLPISAKVDRASRIFVGKASNVELKREANLYAVDLIANVDEVILPKHWRPEKVIHMHLVLDLTRDQAANVLLLSGRHMIFLLMNPWDNSDFTGAGDYNQIAVPVTERAKVEEELKKRVENRK